MTTYQAKKIIKNKLIELNLPFTKLTAKTISFTDLARAECIFVSIHGWKSSPHWDTLKTLAVENGFRILDS